ncbi:ATP phosphoribosyltransferase [Leptospira perolatii]|uniref:ATP phosphoribosyltransferase n=1 Tax=Leptospira perolatii TaxID=2023191 RepID=A0A2M9ZN74_9LEPT|nr:ATP phosphoribosyltransferase [Leptospira perolatii]PJZ68671.1 ATP phosphoribosyltransferase [Leptospira perolatii]PJZ73507.1 ATP phosphoribosyltransferase [Leptospira perolatii]
MLTLALPKGRLAEESIDLMTSTGWLEGRPDPESKELVYKDSKGRVKILLVRSQDVATYVEQNAADAGIVGWDVLKEGGYDLLLPLDLGIGKCRLSLAAPSGWNPEERHRKVRVATKYPNLAREYFLEKGIDCEVIKLYGSIELAPIVGLSDCIVDLVSTGATLKANNLVETEVILESTARLVFNRSSLYSKRKEAKEFLDSFTSIEKQL